jgi:hypothetical protein
MNYKEAFAAERYENVKSPMLSYRIDPFVRSVEARGGKNKGNIMSFVRGLRLAALIIYQIRTILSGTNLSAYWGQIIDRDYSYLSNECDIIIGTENAHEQKWNGSGDGNDIMDFRFIMKDDVKAVISCKSFLTKNKIEEEYCENLLKYVNKVWLFAECCGPNSVQIIAEESKGFGYEHFWHLYTWNRNTGDCAFDVGIWKDFERKVLDLVDI